MRSLGALVMTLVLLLPAGCGYHRAGSGDNLGGIGTLHITLFENQTFEPFVENAVTNAVTERFLRTRRWRLVENPATADGVFSGEVSVFQTVPVSFDRNDNVLEYRAEMTATAVLRANPEGQVLWKGSASWSEEYPGSLDKGQQEDYKRQAIRDIADRLAEELYFRLTDNF